MGQPGSELLFGKQASVTCREDGWETELRGDEEGKERRRFLRPLQHSKSLHYRFFFVPCVGGPAMASSSWLLSVYYSILFRRVSSEYSDEIYSLYVVLMNFLPALA